MATSARMLVKGGMIHDTSHGREGEVRCVGPYLWGHHCHDPRLCLGWLGPPAAGPNGWAKRQSWRLGRRYCVAQFMKDR